ncbi:MAG: response regulator [Bacteroidota bacterium]
MGISKNRNSRKILYLIDDDIFYRDLLHHVLEREGFTVRSFEDGYLALESFHNYPPDGIICDIEMPVVSGIMLFHHYKKSSFYDRKIPFIYISGIQEASKIDKAEELSGRALIRKSLPILTVSKRIKKAVSGI